MNGQITCGRGNSGVKAHSEKWTLKYKLMKWEGGRPIEETKLFGSFGAAYDYYYRKYTKLYHTRTHPGLFWFEWTIMPPQGWKERTQSVPRRLDRSFSLQNLHNPHCKKK